MVIKNAQARRKLSAALHEEPHKEIFGKHESRISVYELGKILMHLQANIFATSNWITSKILRNPT